MSKSTRVTPADVRKRLQIEKAWRDHENQCTAFDVHVHQALDLFRPVVQHQLLIAA